MSVFLVGMRGVGKTTAGTLAAHRLGVPFVDADLAVEKRAGRSVAEIFAVLGERIFRDLEADVVLSLLDGPDHLVATGGGCVLHPDVRGALRQRRSTLWLTAPIEILAARVAGSGRPSLTGARAEGEVATILRIREPMYEECATATLETHGRSVEEVADAIQQFWNTLPNHHLR